MSEAARYANLHPPTWSVAVFFASLVVIFVPLLLLFFVDNRRLERRLYWSGCIGGGVLMALSLLYRGWVVSAITMGAIVLVAVMLAVRFSAYLKVGWPPSSPSERITDTQTHPMESFPVIDPAGRARPAGVDMSQPFARWTPTARASAAHHYAGIR
jgi:hypothetical protein